MTSKQSLLLCSLAAISAVAVSSFQTPLRPREAFLSSRTLDDVRSGRTRLHSDTRGKNGKTKFGQRTDADVSRFLTDFRTADGRVVDPYKMLQVKRSATRMEIKQSYRRLSRKLHPDMVAQSEILPGRCADLEDVREEWERVKFSYEILSDPKTRKSYDRNSSVAEVLEDPGAAVGRAVVGGAMSGIGMVLGGAWKLGEMATKKVYETAVTEKEAAPGKKRTTADTAATKSSLNSFGPVESSTETFGPIGAEKQRHANAINVLTPESDTEASEEKNKSTQKEVGKGFAKK